MVYQTSRGLSLSLINSALPRELSTIYILPNPDLNLPSSSHPLEATTLNGVFIMPLECNCGSMLFHSVCLRIMCDVDYSVTCFYHPRMRLWEPSTFKCGSGHCVSPRCHVWAFGCHFLPFCCTTVGIIASDPSVWFASSLFGSLPYPLSLQYQLLVFASWNSIWFFYKYARLFVC